MTDKSATTDRSDKRKRKIESDTPAEHPKKPKSEAKEDKKKVKKTRKGGLDDQPEPQKAAEDVTKAIKDMQKTIKEGFPMQMAADYFKMQLLFIMKDLFAAGATFAREKAEAGERF